MVVGNLLSVFIDSNVLQFEVSMLQRSSNALTMLLFARNKLHFI